MTIDATHDPDRACWVPGATGHADFPIQNLPFGVFDPGDGDRRIGVAIGDHILDVRAAAALLPLEARDAVAQTMLNALFAAGAPLRVALRRAISDLLSNGAHRAAVEPLLHAAADCTLHLPAAIGDYTDFYTGIHHANNIGRQFRPDNPLLPNYKYVPIGYHGRSSSIRPSGVAVRWPHGQRKGPDDDVPSYGPSRRLDYELELGVWIGSGNALGEPIAIDRVADHIAGFCLLNDWSARDLQAWEYQPLGPFLAKNFHSTISPWVVTAEAMAPFRIAQPPRPEGDPAPLDYLRSDADQAAGALAVELEVFIATERMRAEGIAPHRLSIGPASNMYWTVAQMVTHHASNGCPLMPGDLLGTGTISTPEPGGFGSLMEISQGGKAPVTLPTGETRIFLQPGDEIAMRATARAEGYRPIGFGPCTAVVTDAAG
jgi:fumarylacetoacetase